MTKTKATIYKSEGLIYPFDTLEFINAWGLWLEYRKEIKKPIKGKISQQAALKKIAKLANGEEAKGIAIIEQSLENNWRGLFDIKINRNESIKETNDDLTDALFRRFAS